ncbi:MAG: hypothetical protein DI546_01625 [Rhizobium sp.]|nr:MAG: hypothetical protein DI546_01625 [Rhizobium sp.]
MIRFYFNVVAAASRILDEEGRELADLDAARAEAIQDARALMSEAILSGKDISDRSVEICDEAGRTVLVVPFSDAINRFD